MVWHIFKKDWKLLWPFFLAVAVVQFIPAAIRVKLGLFGEDPVLGYVLIPATVVAIFGVAFLAAAIVQQDSIPGVRQDWLVRPVRRRDLLLAKLLFILVLVEGTAIAAATLQVLESGFSLHQSLSAAFFQNLFLISAITLPAIALASATKTIVECVIGSIVAYLGGAAILIAFAAARGGDERLEAAGTGSWWIMQSAVLLVILLGTCFVLGTQYLYRRTAVARGSIALSCVLFVAVLEFLPWKPLFAFQQHLSSQPGAAHAMTLSFDAALGKYHQPSGITLSDQELWERLHKPGTPAELFLPLSISGLPDDSILKTDKSEVRLISANGKVAYRGVGEYFEVREEGASNRQSTAYQEFDVPETVYSRLKSQTLRVEIDYSLTLFRLETAFGIPALGGDLRSPRLGWCETQMNESGSAIELRCMQAGKGPTCGTAFLENPSTGMRNPGLSICDPDYAPRFIRSDVDPTSHYGLNLRFRDPSGLTQYPVDGPQLPKSQVVLRLYEPQDHFTRQLTIPAISLPDWESK